MATPVGAPPCVTLAGYDLTGVAAQEVAVKATQVKTILEGGALVRREHLAYREPGYPVRLVKHDFTIRYEQLSKRIDRVEAILAGAGPFTFCLWKAVTLQYVGDGARSEFFFDWPVAVHTLTPPNGLAAALYEPIVQVAIDGTPLTYSAQVAGTYAGTPASGNVWFLDDGQAFKLPTAPAAGSLVVARIVPLFSVLEAPLTDKRYQSPLREPRDLMLVEA